MSNPPAALAKRFGLVKSIAVSQYRLKDQSTTLGFVWSFLHPVLMLGVLYLFFSQRVGQDVENYPLYLLVGIVHYIHFANTTSSSMRALFSMRHLTKNVVMPKEVLVLGTVSANGLEFLFSLGICAALSLASGVEPLAVLVALPLSVALQFLLVTWVSLALSCLYLFARDLDHIYQVFLRVLFFVTPIFYHRQFLEAEWAERLLALNPLAQLIDLTRSALVEGLWINPCSPVCFEVMGLN